MREPQRRSSSFSSPTAFSSWSERRELEHTSSANSGLWWAGVIFSGFISCSSTGMPRWASCQAASQPARPAPMIYHWFHSSPPRDPPALPEGGDEVFWGFRPAARGGRRTALSSVAAYAATPSPQEGEGFSGGWKPPLRVPFGLCAPAVPMSGPRLCTGTGPRPARPIDTGRGTEAPSSVAAYAATPSPRGNAFRTAGSRPCGFPSAFARPPSP